MGQVNLADYKNIYLQTAKEYVDKVSVSLNQLSTDSSNKEALNNVHIASHSLKSQSQVMGFTDIASLSAIIEKNSNGILNGATKVDDKFLDLLKNSIDEFNIKLDQIEKTP